MATYGKSGEVRKMGIGAMIVRGAVVTAAGGLLYAAVLNPIMSKISGSNAVVEQGYVSPKALSIQGKKNAAGNIETYVQYKSGDEIVSLPCMKGPNGPLCGKVDYWWDSIGAGPRKDLTVSEWPLLPNDAKHGILSSEIQALLDTAYGTRNGTQKVPQPQYQQPKQK